MNVRELEPISVWNHFADLNAVPRPSKKEERVIAFIQNFGEKLGLETYTDKVGNVIIKKPATAGMENRQTVILQSHLDMVHQKNADTLFDFETQGIEMLVDGDWVKAKGTTLGADNGMGVAAIMGILSSKDISHPSIEALFTIDEETGMTGAMELEKGILKGSILLNLDTEDDDEFSIGCAGGIDTNTSFSYSLSPISEGSLTYKIVVNGLNGGHSGVQINEELGNANKIMNRLLHGCEEYNLQIVEVDGGSLRNAIPRESFATITANPDYLEEFNKRTVEIKNEYVIQDPDLSITIEPINQARLKLVPNDMYALLSKSKFALVTSGTATLETALMGVPQIVCYTTNRISYWIGKSVIKVKYISLVNLILDKKSIIELIQDEFNPKKLKSEIEKLIEDKNTQDEISQDYQELRKKLGTSIPSITVAKSVVTSFDKV